MSTKPEEPTATEEGKKEITLDEALRETGFGKFNWAVIILCGMTISSVFMESVSINIILPLAQCDLELESIHKGFLSGITKVGVLTSSFIWGYLADTKGRKFVMAVPMLVAASFSVMSVFAPNFWVLLLLRLLNGIFISGPSASVFAFVGEFQPVEMRSRVMMYTSVVYGILGYWNPVSASLFLNQYWRFDLFGITLKPWRLFFMIASIPTLICSICLLLFIPESPKYTFTQGDEEKTLKILKYAHEMNNMKGEFNIKSLHKDDEFGKLKQTENKRNPLQSVLHQTVPLFKHSLFNITRASYLQFSSYFVSSGFWVFFPEISNGIHKWIDENGREGATLCQIHHHYSTRQQGGSECMEKYESGAFVNVFILNTIYSCGWIVLAFIIDKCGKKFAINTMLLISSVSAVLLVFISDAMIENVLYLAMLSVGIAGSVVNASTAELFPTQYRAMALSISLIIGRLGGVLGALFLGSLMKDYCTVTLVVPAIMFTVCALFVMTLPSEVMKKQVQNPEKSTAK